MEGNSIALVSSYVTKAKGSKPTFAINKEAKQASNLYGMDLTNKDKEVTSQINK